MRQNCDISTSLLAFFEVIYQTRETVFHRMLLIPGTGNGERGTGNGERGTGNGERGTGNGERGTGVWEREYNGNSPDNSKWRRKRRLQTLILSLGRVDD